MTTMKSYIQRHPVLTYYVLTFAISWAGFFLVGIPGGFPSANWRTAPLFLPAVLATLAGPIVAGLLLTGLTDGRPGLRELRSRLLKWRVGLGWYAVALLPAPILAATVLFVLSLPSPLSTSGDKVAVVLSGSAAGLVTIFEELGWTGFAVPRLRRRYSVVRTGLIVGILWAAWHLPVNVWTSETEAGALPLALFIPLYFLSFSVGQLTAYRLLLVWVYDRTGSLLVTWLMHTSLSASTIFILGPLATGAPLLADGFVLAAALWLVVAAVALASGGQLARHSLRRQVA